METRSIARWTYTWFKGLDLYSNLFYFRLYIVCNANLDDTTSGVEEVGVKKLEVYPNPVLQSLVISQQSLVNTVEIMDVLGRIVMVRQAHHYGVGGNAEERSISIDVSAIPSGIYFIKTTDVNGNVMNGKFVKE